MTLTIYLLGLLISGIALLMVPHGQWHDIASGIHMILGVAMIIHVAQHWKWYTRQL